MDKVILETMLSESEARERIARNVIEDLRKQINKEIRVVLIPANRIAYDIFESMKPKEIYDLAEEKGYPIYSDKQFCKIMNFDEINLDNYFITITKDY